MTEIGTTQSAPVKTGNAAPSGVTGNAGMFGGLSGLNFMDLLFGNSMTTGLTNAIQNATPAADGKGPKAALFTQIAFTANTQTLTAQQLASVAPDTLPGISTADMALLYPENFAADADNATVTLTTDADATAEVTVTVPATTEQSGETAAGLLTTQALPPVPLSARKDIAAIIKTLLHGTPQTAGNGADGDTTDESALIATALTPAQLAVLTDKLNELGETGASGDKSAAAGLIAAIVKLLPPQSKNILPENASVQAQASSALTTFGQPKKAQKDKNGDITGAEALLPAQTVAATDIVSKAADSLAAHLNAVLTGDKETPIFAPNGPTAGKDGQQVPNFTAANNNNATAQNAASHSNAGGSAIGATGGESLDSLLNSAGWDSIYPDGLDWTQNTSGTQHGTLSVTGTTQFASLVAHAQSATTPHPATQMVAATLTKTVSDGETKSLTLKLDPPELGRVEIKLDFAKEKGMKAHIVVDKQETYLMLQRDSHVLQRALEDAGLTADGNGLSFELSQNGGTFDDGHNGSNRGGGGSSGRGDSVIDTEQTIESTMNWSVDAHGMTHYDILA